MKEVYKNSSFEITNLIIEAESKEYNACQFQLDNLNIISRDAKITPKKVGQFVTFWKRSKKGPIEPFNETDLFDFFVVNVIKEDCSGQFVFPKSILTQKEIISTPKKEGKRAFRVYPPWDKTATQQANKTQKWQLNYFYKTGNSIDLDQMNRLYKIT